MPGRRAVALALVALSVVLGALSIAAPASGQAVPEVVAEPVVICIDPPAPDEAPPGEGLLRMERPGASRPTGATTDAAEVPAAPPVGPPVDTPIDELPFGCHVVCVDDCVLPPNPCPLTEANALSAEHTRALRDREPVGRPGGTESVPAPIPVEPDGGIGDGAGPPPIPPPLPPPDCEPCVIEPSICVPPCPELIPLPIGAPIPPVPFECDPCFIEPGLCVPPCPEPIPLPLPAEGSTPVLPPIIPVPPCDPCFIEPGLCVPPCPLPLPLPVEGPIPVLPPPCDPCFIDPGLCVPPCLEVLPLEATASNLRRDPIGRPAAADAAPESAPVPVSPPPLPEPPLPEPPVIVPPLPPCVPCGDPIPVDVPPGVGVILPVLPPCDPCFIDPGLCDPCFFHGLDPLDCPDIDDYIGLPINAAIEQVEADGFIWRIARDGDQFFALTEDFIPNRVNFEIDEGIVTYIWLG